MKRLLYIVLLFFTVQSFGQALIKRNAFTTNAAPHYAAVTNALSLTGSTTTFLRSDGTQAAPAGAGTVTSVSVTTANGVSGSVATATTTPAISLTLGAITPSSVAIGATNVVTALSTKQETNFTSPFTGAVSRTVESKMQDIISVLDFGFNNAGLSINQTNLDNLQAYLTTNYLHARVLWPAGDYLLPSTLSLTNIRGFSFIGEGGSVTSPKTRIRHNGSGAGDHGVLSLTSCTDFFLEGIEFVAGGASASDQAIELKADPTPLLSCGAGVIRNCTIRRLTTTPEFTYAALYIRNSAQLEIIDCYFPVAGKSIRLGNTINDEPTTFGNGHVAQIRIHGNQFYGDVERVFTSQVEYSGNFFDLKTDALSEPAVMTIASSGYIRNDIVFGNYCDPGATNKTRTFYMQGTNSLSAGLTAFGNRVGDVAIGFDLTYGFANLNNNYSSQDVATDTFVNIRSTATKVTSINNEVALLTAAGGAEITDATSGVYKQPAFNAMAPDSIKTGSIGFTVDGGGSAITTGKTKGFFVCPYAATIAGWSIVVDTGTATVKAWKIASGTAKPTIANVINTSGVAISSGTAVISTTTSDFTTTTVAANDIFAFDVTAVSGATELTFQLKLTK